MSKEQKIKEWTEFAMTHLSDIIPYNIPNYDEVLLDEAKYYIDLSSIREKIEDDF